MTSSRRARVRAILGERRGSAVASFAVAAPLVIALMAALLQLTGYVHTVTVAQSAVDEAARQAGRYGGDPTTARLALLDTLASAVPGATVTGLAMTADTLPAGTPLLVVTCSLTVSGPAPFSRSSVTLTGRAVDEARLS